MGIFSVNPPHFAPPRTAPEGSSPESSIENWATQTRIQRALATLAPLFAEADIPLCPIKGALLGRYLYADIAERPIRDLDLLVRRSDLARLRRIVERARWPLVRDSNELGELEFQLCGVTVEAHTEVGRLEITTLRAEDLLARATEDTETFPFAIRRIDDVDHALLLSAELVKDWFVEANRHQPEDLERLLSKIAARRSVLIIRAREAGFVTGLYNVARWLADEHGSAAFQSFLRELGPPPRKIQPLLVRAASRAPFRNRYLGLALSSWTNDVWRVRARCLARIARRRILRAVGMEPG